MTLEGRSLIKEGWLTLYKSKKSGLFNSKPAPNKHVDRGWAVIHDVANPSKVPSIVFYQDNRKEKVIMKKDKIDLACVKCVTRMCNHPKHPHAFTLQLKGSKRLILNADNQHDLEVWMKVVCEVTHLDYKREKVIWEYYDGGLWNAHTDVDSFSIENHFCDGSHNFTLNENSTEFNYNLNHMVKTHPRTRATHRIKRTAFVEERPEVFHKKMLDLPAFWEWGEESDGIWHPFERETNIQIEDMYDSGSQWAELTLCLPSPMPFLLDLHDMKLVNFRTAVRYNLRRIDNENFQQAPSIPEPRSPSPDDLEQPPQPNMMSPMSPLFRPIQEHLKHLQVPRTNITYKNMLGEGAFGEVYLASVVGLPGYGNSVGEVAVKQLRLSDFIARHGHHTQQMEDFLREAKEMEKVDHHRVVKLIAVCTLDYPLLLIEEYMDQGDLLGVLKDSRPSMPLERQLTFAIHTADGMDYLASQLNCVHRDLAARNILVHRNDDGTMDAKIADFGLSRHLYSEMYKTQGSKPRPLPAKWMALESLMYFVFTTKSDVWSYGVLLWEIMSLGRSPYPGVENRELLEQLEEKGLKLSRPKPCPSAVYEMILDCTQHKEADRPIFNDIRSRLKDIYAKKEKGELDVSDESIPASPASVAAAATETGGEAKESKGEQDGAGEDVKKKEDKVKQPEDKGKENKKKEVNEETIEGHTYSIIDKGYKKKAGGSSSQAAAPSESDDKRQSATHEDVDGLPPINGSPPPIPPQMMEAKEGVGPSCNHKTSSPTKALHQEVTPDGHLYYLLDPSDKRERPPVAKRPHASPSKSQKQKSASALPPPLPNNHPSSSSSSPTHHPSSNGNDGVELSPRSRSSLLDSTRPKAHSVATTDARSNKKKSNSLGRSTEISRR